MKPYHPFILFIFFWAFLPSVALSQKNKFDQHRFYDFNVSLELLRYPFPNIDKNEYKKLNKKVLEEHSEWLYVVQNEGRYFEEATQKQKEFEKGYLHIIQYLNLIDPSLPDSNNIVRETVATLKVKLSSSQQDTIYMLTKKLFQLNDKPNLSPDRRPTPPPVDGDVAIVKLDLNDRGNRYKVTIPPKFRNDQNLMKLLSYLEEIKNQPTTKPLR